jgi:hypothetical protein
MAGSGMLADMDMACGVLVSLWCCSLADGCPACSGAGNRQQPTHPREYGCAARASPIPSRRGLVGTGNWRPCSWCDRPTLSTNVRLVTHLQFTAMCSSAGARGDRETA